MKSIHWSSLTKRTQLHLQRTDCIDYAGKQVGGWLHLPLNPERLRKLTENYISSNEKIKKALGVERMPVDARKGLERSLESFK